MKKKVERDTQVAAGSIDGDGDSHFEDTEAYAALRGHLEVSHRVRDFNDIFMEDDLLAGADESYNFCLRMMYTVTIVGAFVYPITHTEFFVPPQSVGLVIDKGGCHLFAQAGWHNLRGMFWRMRGIVPLEAGKPIIHGDRAVVVIDQGFIGYAADRGQPVLLPPGIHCWKSDTLKFIKQRRLSDHFIELGPYTIVTVDEGYVSIAQENGKQKILGGGQTHFLPHVNFKHEKYLSLKVQTDELEAIECTTADNVNVLVNSTVNWRIVDPHVTAIMAANTQSLSGSDADASRDISKLKKDVLKQALASMASFVGSVNYSGSFHVSAAQNSDRAAKAQAEARASAAAKIEILDPSTAEESLKEASAPEAIAVDDLWLENPLYNYRKMNSAMAHANTITATYGIEIISINIISAVPSDSALTKSLASGAVAAAESLVAETAARGQAAALMIAAAAESDAALLKAEGAKQSEIKKAEGEAEGIRLVGDALSSKSGSSAAQQRLAEQYVNKFSDMARDSNLVIIPDKPNDVSGVIASAMSVGNAIKKHAHYGDE